jgi:hypothetical protein
MAELETHPLEMRVDPPPDLRLKCAEQLIGPNVIV